MRENVRLHPKISFRELINLSINETLSRTIITTLTVLFALFVLYFFGGEVINSFAFAMLIGCISGVYSTIALTTPLVFTWSHGEYSDGQNTLKPATRQTAASVARNLESQPAKQVVKRHRRHHR
jgi:preprotein translocase subunit SecF